MKKKELLECLRGWSMDGRIDNWREEDEQAYKEIVALIKKEVTKEWIDKKAKEMCMIANVEFFIYAQDFVRSIAEEIRGE